MTNRFPAFASMLAIAGVFALTAAAQAQERTPLVDAARDWLGLIAVVISLGTIVVTWLTAGSSKNAKTLDSHEKRLNAHAERLTQVENDIKHLPAKDDVTELKIAMAELKGTIGRLDEHLSGISGTVRRMDDFLRQGDR
jgi:hypothetical protein